MQIYLRGIFFLKILRKQYHVITVHALSIPTPNLLTVLVLVWMKVYETTW